MNAELYGGPEPPSPATILDYRRTKRPPPFERLAAVRASAPTVHAPAAYWYCGEECSTGLCIERGRVLADSLMAVK